MVIKVIGYRYTVNIKESAIQQFNCKQIKCYSCVNKMYNLLNFI